jgi:hypothetical protein
MRILQLSVSVDGVESVKGQQNPSFIFGREGKYENMK